MWSTSYHGYWHHMPWMYLYFYVQKTIKLYTLGGLLSGTTHHPLMTEGISSDTTLPERCTGSITDGQRLTLGNNSFKQADAFCKNSMYIYILYSLLSQLHHEWKFQHLQTFWYNWWHGVMQNTAMFCSREGDRLVYSSREYTLTPACISKGETILLCSEAIDILSGPIQVLA